MTYRQLLADNGARRGVVPAMPDVPPFVRQTKSIPGPTRDPVTGDVDDRVRTVC